MKIKQLLKDYKNHLLNLIVRLVLLSPISIDKTYKWKQLKEFQHLKRIHNYRDNNPSHVHLNSVPESTRIDYIKQIIAEYIPIEDVINFKSAIKKFNKAHAKKGFNILDEKSLDTFCEKILNTSDYRGWHNIGTIELKVDSPLAKHYKFISLKLHAISKSSTIMYATLYPSDDFKNELKHLMDTHEPRHNRLKPYFSNGLLKFGEYTLSEITVKQKKLDELQNVHKSAFTKELTKHFKGLFYKNKVIPPSFEVYSENQKESKIKFPTENTYLESIGLEKRDYSTEISPDGFYTFYYDSLYKEDMSNTLKFTYNEFIKHTINTFEVSEYISIELEEICTFIMPFLLYYTYSIHFNSVLAKRQNEIFSLTSKRKVNLNDTLNALLQLENNLEIIERLHQEITSKELNLIKYEHEYYFKEYLECHYNGVSPSSLKELPNYTEEKITDNINYANFLRTKLNKIINVLEIKSQKKSRSISTFLTISSLLIAIISLIVTVISLGIAFISLIISLK